MSISVIVPTLIKNNRQFAMTIKCLESAKLTNIPYELIIVETETAYLRSYADVYIYEKKKTTATKSINRGFRASNSDYLVLLTNDVILDEGWLESLSECFLNKDCGIATLATTQLGHTKRNEISEGIWFSVAMFPKQPTYFDERYVNSWDDTDFIMRQYLKGYKMYRNYNCVVEHSPGQTQYAKKDHVTNFEKNRKLFLDKYKDHVDKKIYKILVEGYVL